MIYWAACCHCCCLPGKRRMRPMAEACHSWEEGGVNSEATRHGILRVCCGETFIVAAAFFWPQAAL